MLECYRPIFRTGVNEYDKGLANEVIVFFGNAFPVVDDFDGSQAILFHADL